MKKQHQIALKTQSQLWCQTEIQLEETCIKNDDALLSVNS